MYMYTFQSYMYAIMWITSTYQCGMEGVNQCGMEGVNHHMYMIKEV